GEYGGVLSGGQAQRIALARAVYRRPKLVVLDEPNANLDAAGDQALSNCIAALRNAGSTVIVMTHRPSAINAVNEVLMLSDGRQVQFGDRDEVMRKVTPLHVAGKSPFRAGAGGGQ
ncbi:MAG: ATP-binding cassette domain-containing protein, partial [Pseudomonadota bacterium]